MEGCSKYCSYCVVPYTRGTEVSRPLNDIIDEVNNLVENGTKEIILLGQTNAYFYENEKGDIINLVFYYFIYQEIKESKESDILHHIQTILTSKLIWPMKNFHS